MQGDDKGITGAVAAEDEFVIRQGGRAAVAVHGRVLDGVIFPGDLAIETEGRGAHVAEVHVHLLAIYDRGGAGLAVLAMHARGGVHVEDRGVPEQLAVFGTEAKGVERKAFAFFDGAGEVDFAVQNHGRTPAAAGDGGFPLQVIAGCTNVDRQLRVGVALCAGSSELRPVVGVKMQSQQGGRPGESSFHERSVVGQ